VNHPSDGITLEECLCYTGGDAGVGPSTVPPPSASVSVHLWVLKRPSVFLSRLAGVLDYGALGPRCSTGGHLGRPCIIHARLVPMPHQGVVMGDEEDLVEIQPESTMSDEATPTLAPKYAPHPPWKPLSASARSSATCTEQSWPL
jgi:hypothetical protein